MDKPTQKHLPPAEWPLAWLSAIFSAISSLDGKHGFHGDYWRAYVLVSRDTNWQYACMMAIRFDQIAPDGTVVLYPANNPVPLIVRLSKDALAAIEPLRHKPDPSGRIFFGRRTYENVSRLWVRIGKAAGFNRTRDEVLPGIHANAPRPVAGSPPVPILGEPQTLMQFLDHTYAPLRLGGKSANTLRLYRISIRNLCRYLERDAMLADLTDETLAAYLGWLRARKYSPHTIQKEYCQLTAMWRFACQRRMIEMFPTVQKPKAPRTDPCSWLQNDLNKLFKAISECPGEVGGEPAADWWRALHYVIWNTGERIGAVMALQWSDLDLDGKWVIVRAEYRKGKCEDKTHAIADYTVQALRAIQHSRRAEVFPWPHHKTVIFSHYGQILKRAGLPTDRLSKFHRMRRTVATQFELLGGDATKLLGHYDRSVTEGHYLDPRVVRRPQAIDLLPRPDVLNEGSGGAAGKVGAQ